MYCFRLAGVDAPPLIPLDADGLGDFARLEGGPSESDFAPLVPAVALDAGFLTDAGDLSFDALPPPACLAFVLPPLPSGTRPLRSSFEAAWVVVGERGGTA